MIIAGSVGLLVDVFAGSWFTYPSGWYAGYFGSGFQGVVNGWQGLPWLGPVAVLVALMGIVSFAAQALRRSPALPIVLTTLLMPVALLLVVALALRTLVAVPNTAVRRLGGAASLEVGAAAYVGLGLSVVLAVGLYVSLRREGVAAADTPAAIETIKLETAAGT